jgi:hypothetical protein
MHQERASNSKTLLCKYMYLFILLLLYIFYLIKILGLYKSYPP